MGGGKGVGIEREFDGRVCTGMDVGAEVEGGGVDWRDEWEWPGGYPNESAEDSSYSPSSAGKSGRRFGVC